MKARLKALWQRGLPWLVNGCRLLLAITFLFSGWVKANDPLGTTVKLDDYAVAWGITSANGLLTLATAVALAFAEISLGVCLLFGLNRRVISRLTLFFMVVMTVLTAWLYATDAVSDCGCFGDVLILSNGETLLKNIVLLTCAAVVWRWYRLQKRFIGENNAWLVSMPLMLGAVALAAYSIYALPMVDFRPFHEGANVRQMWEQPKLQSRRTYKLHELDVADWAVQRETEDGYAEEITEDILYDAGYVFLLIAPNLATADQGCAGDINVVYDLAQRIGASFYCLTASDVKAQLRWSDYTGAEYPFGMSDERLLKTMVRANPGLILMHDGIVLKKWSNWNLPDEEEAEGVINSKF